MSDHSPDAGKMARQNCDPAEHRPHWDTVDGKTAACRHRGCEVLLVATGPCSRCDGLGKDVHHGPCLECDGTGLEGWRENP